MSRIPTVEVPNSKATELLEMVNKKLGVTPNMTKVLANSPAALEAYLGFSGALAGATLSAKTREAIALVVGELNSCEYCLSAHTVIGAKTGLTAEEIMAARKGKATDAKLQATLSLASAVVEKKGFLSDQDLADARRAGMSNAELVETIATVSLNVFTNYINHAAQPEIDFPKAEALGSCCSGTKCC